MYVLARIAMDRCHSNSFTKRVCIATGHHLATDLSTPLMSGLGSAHCSETIGCMVKGSRLASAGRMPKMHTNRVTSVTAVL